MTELRKVTQLKLKAFLDTEYGIEVLLYLRERAPKIKRGQEHEIVFDGGRVDGYVECLDTLISASETPINRNIEIENK